MCTGADLSGRRQDHDARSSRADQLLDAARCRSLEHFVRIDALDDVTDRAPFDGAAGTGDDDLIELDGALREREVGGDRLSGGHGDVAIFGREAEHARAQLNTAGGDGSDRVFALGIGPRAELEAAGVPVVHEHARTPISIHH